MSYLEIKGGKPLCGEITIQGSKNASLPVLTACLLGEGPCIIENCPKIRDVEDTLAILRLIGCQAEREGDAVRIDPAGADRYEIIGTEAVRIRSSVLFLGALLGKMKKAKLPYPGGCAIGRRPIDLHMDALRRLGAVFSDEEFWASQGCIYAEADMLRGGNISLAIPSVGATENAVLAAVLAQGETVIQNAAQEPEIDELCRFLNLRGADIVRKQDGSLHISGVPALSPATYRLGADRIVAGTYLLAAAAAGGSVGIRSFPPGQLDLLLWVLRRMGVELRQEDGLAGGAADGGHPDGGILYAASTGVLRAVPYIRTGPYPEFPTDLQSPLMAVLCRAQGESRICETMFENRFRTAEQLCRMGARIAPVRDCALIEGVRELHGAELSAPDLRGGAALVIAALQSAEVTRIRDYAYIARGYENICRDLTGLGADIRLVEE